MNGTWQHGLRQLVFGALLVPFLLVSMIASHLMPARQADGSMVLVLCTADGPQTIAIDPASGEPVEKQDQQSTSTCHWASAAQAVTLTPVVGLPQMAGSAMTLRRHIPTVTLSAARATGLPPSTGPPFAA